jgi:pimeloyl-ACP methyl ester carboxylesterase
MGTMIKKGYADASGGQIHYRYLAGHGTPIVLLHQTASSSVMYEKMMARLEGFRPLYALDTPGFGGSFDPPGMPPLGQYVTWIAEAIESIGLRRFHLVGHHTGGFIAGEIAARHPERVASFVMIGASVLNESERAEFRKAFQAPIGPTVDGSYLLDTWHYLAKLGADRDLALHHRELVDTARAYMGRYQAYTALWDQDFAVHLRNVRCPILFLSSRDDVLYPYFEAAKAVRPDAKSILLEGANFEPDLDPDGTAAAIRDFVSDRG